MNILKSEELIAARVRDTLASAALKEMKLQILKGEYISVEAVTKERSDEAHRVKTKLLALPASLSARLVGIRDVQEIYELLSSAVNKVLNELADGEESQSKSGS